MNSDPYHIGAEIQQRVKANAPSAAFGAACLILFGFMWYQLRALYIINLFSAGEAMSSYAMRIGGVILLLVALWSYTGQLASLMADAIVSVLIGVTLIGSALLMMVGGGMGINQILFIVFGFMFASAGWRNGRDFLGLSRLRAAAGDVRHQPDIPQSAAPPMTPPPPSFSQPSPDQPTTGSLASELRRRKSVPTRRPTDDPYASEEPAEAGFIAEGITEDELAASEAVDEAQSDTIPLEKSRQEGSHHDDTLPEDSPVDDSPAAEPPPDGFLSSFADEE